MRSTAPPGRTARARLGALVVFVATLGLAVVGAAGPAAAHAILLRTEPSSQTTVDAPPTAVKLFFSEPVEAAFGAVRVFDVDGRRVDSGRVSLADGGREVDVDVPRLADGTYTLTWRVVSTDGHPVHGGFSFYVGAPSSISAVAVAPTAGGSPALAKAYGAVRFAWFAGLLAVVGLVVARRWVWTPAVRSTGLSESPAATGFRRRFAVALPAAWTVLALSGLLVVVFQAASASGLSLATSATPSVLRQELSTQFGRLWLLQIALTAAMAAPVYALSTGRRLLAAEPHDWVNLLLVMAAGLCVAAALNGHARTLGPPVVNVTSVAAHLIAVGVWVGGLGALVVVAGPAWRALPGEARPALVAAVIARFSRIAMAAVGVVVATGVLNTVFDLSSVSDLWRTRYGQVIVAKVLLLGIALALASRHRWVTPRQLRAAVESRDLVGVAPGAGATVGPAAPTGPTHGDDRAVAAARSFERSALLELAALVAAVALAAALVALVPGRSLAQAAKGPVNLERQAGGYTVQLFVDPSRVGDNQVHVTFVDAAGLGAAGVTNTQVTVAAGGAEPQPVPMRLISPGHFVGDTTLPNPGPYKLAVSAGPDATTTFQFRLRGQAP